MFDIEYKGANCVVISSKTTKLVSDPKLSLVGLKDIKIDDKIVQLVTDDRFMIDGSKSKLTIDSPGEYGIAEFDILGIRARRHIDDDSLFKSIMYRICIDDVRIGLLGNIHYELSDEQYEKIGVIDVLIIPIGGGGYTLDAINAQSIIKQIEPKVVIPVHYSDKSIKYEVSQDDLDTFVQKLGVNVEELDKFKSKTLANYSDKLTIIKLNRT